MISAYHQKYINQPEEEIQRRINEKDDELKRIFEAIPPLNIRDKARVAIMGCGDKRFVKAHKTLFEKYLKKNVDLTTFDISVEHLKGEVDAVEHDCTLPLPHIPYDITYAHVLLKFIPLEKQWDVIINSYEALRTGGIAIHVLDKEDYTNFDIIQKDGYNGVPLEKYIKSLTDGNIKYMEIPVKYGVALVLIKVL